MDNKISDLTATKIPLCNSKEATGHMPTESKILAPLDKLIDFLTFLIDILLSESDCNEICNANFLQNGAF